MWLQDRNIHSLQPRLSARELYRFVGAVKGLIHPSKSREQAYPVKDQCYVSCLLGPTYVLLTE